MRLRMQLVARAFSNDCEELRYIGLHSRFQLICPPRLNGTAAFTRTAVRPTTAACILKLLPLSEAQQTWPGLLLPLPGRK